MEGSVSLRRVKVALKTGLVLSNGSYGVTTLCATLSFYIKVVVDCNDLCLYSYLVYQTGRTRLKTYMKNWNAVN